MSAANHGMKKPIHVFTLTESGYLTIFHRINKRKDSLIWPHAELVRKLDATEAASDKRFTAHHSLSDCPALDCRRSFLCHDCQRYSIIRSSFSLALSRNEYEIQQASSQY